MSEFVRQAGEATSLLKAMANESRLLALCYLAEGGELSVAVLAERVGLGQTPLSDHLDRLREEGLVGMREEAQIRYYHLCDPRAGQLLALLHDLFCPELGQEGAAPEAE